MKRLAFPAIIAAALLVSLTACAGSAGHRSEGAAGGSAPFASHDIAAMNDRADMTNAEADEQGADASAERSVIHTGDVAIEVSDPGAAAARISDIAEAQGGRVESSTVGRAVDDAPASASVTIRVPADRLDTTFSELSGVGTVVAEHRSAIDVTTEHVDLDARVKALESSVERLTALMTEATSTADLLQAESALAERQQELDGLRAQLKSLEGQVSEATVYVSLSTKSALPGGGPANFWEGLLAGLNSMVAAGTGALVLFGVLLPWLLVFGVIGGAIILIVRAAKRKRTRASAPPNKDSAMPHGSQ